MSAITSVDLAIPGVALAVGAHPDDVEFGCGATLAKWAAAGCRVHHLVCTDGSRGSWEDSMDRAELVARRHEEQREAALRLGGGPVTFLDWPDGELEAGARQRWQVVHEIRKVRPDVVLGHDPWRRYRLHPDHRNAGFLVTDAIVAARDPLFFPEQQLPAHRPSSLLLWEADEANHLETTQGFEERKLAAIDAHRSQYRSTMGYSSPSEPAAEEREAFRQRVLGRLVDNGAAGGQGPSEAFRLLEHL